VPYTLQLRHYTQFLLYHRGIGHLSEFELADFVFLNVYIKECAYVTL
jgi:hypothetical protein